MTDWKRRRLVQAGVGIPLVGWSAAWAQTSDRNLTAGERKPAAVAQSGASLLIAPRHALVIGNSSYGFGPLKNPANDAKALGNELKSAGFEVTVGLDLTRKDMLDAIRAYGESLNKAKAIGVFYFAGHGVQLAWRNYLLPTDAEIARLEDIQAKCVDVNAVIEGIAKAANPMNVVILDACRENPFQQVKLDQKGLSQLDAPPGTILAYATAPGNLASDGEGANGLYTEQLLREMKVPQTKIDNFISLRNRKGPHLPAHLAIRIVAGGIEQRCRDLHFERPIFHQIDQWRWLQGRVLHHFGRRSRKLLPGLAFVVVRVRVFHQRGRNPRGPQELLLSLGPKLRICRLNLLYQRAH